MLHVHDICTPFISFEVTVQTSERKAVKLGGPVATMVWVFAIVLTSAAWCMVHVLEGPILFGCDLPGTGESAFDARERRKGDGDESGVIGVT